jgi:hypothetical protein
MLRRHWKILTTAGLVAYVLALWAFALAGFPTHAEVCEITAVGKHCASYNILFATALKAAKAVDHWSALITAIATGVIAWFTTTIWIINRRQLAHSHQVERAYISGGGAPEVQEIDLGTEIIHGVMGGATTRHKGIERRQTGNFMLCVNNYGKTAGELRWVGFGFCDAQNIPASPAYQYRYRYDWIQPGDRGRPFLPIVIPTDRPATAVFGRFYYRDIFDRWHSCGFINEIGLERNRSDPLLAPRAYTEERDEPDLGGGLRDPAT